MAATSSSYASRKHTRIYSSLSLGLVIMVFLFQHHRNHKKCPYFLRITIVFKQRLNPKRTKGGNYQNEISFNLTSFIKLLAKFDSAIAKGKRNSYPSG